MNWWESISMLEKILYILATSSSVILVIQTILALFGIGDDGMDGVDAVDLDVDGSDFGVDDLADVSGLQLLTIRGILAFFAIGGWTSIFCLKSGMKTPFALLIGLLAGFATMLLLAKLMQMAMKLQYSGNINIRNAVGKQGTVYLIIPPKGKGKGKVSVVVQERLREFDAVTESDEDIPTGSRIIVKDVVHPNTLVVEKI
ncbi:MAG: hypothetical protein GX166_13690 [Clostridiaceae bacterium]|jgi:membrane protein implicated in regulation of membrane protease activity|nr:hypothetical protein [Clostridiaceae bacterium]HOA31857.1 hypothetical protein [Clostridia bacterium]